MARTAHLLTLSTAAHILTFFSSPYLRFPFLTIGERGGRGRLISQ